MVDATSSRFRLSLLGRFELIGPGGRVELPSKKLAGLLAYLACTAPQPQPREKLMALLWGSHFDAQAKQNLRQALFRLRKVLGQDALESDGDVVSLNAAAIRCDVGRFEAFVREGSRDALSAAADLYRGRLIDDVTVGEEGWNEWLTGERERLLELALGAMMGLGEQELAAGRAERALKAGQRAIALNNMREDAHRLIVRALAATGRKAEALKHYQNLVALLKHELNTEPDAATRSLVAELQSTTPPGRSPAVKDIARPSPVQFGLPPVAVPFADNRGDPGQELKTGNPTARGDAASSAGAVGQGNSSERRQLTIMACNIVDSMALSARLDPEDMRDLITSFHNVIDDVTARFDGFVAQYLGDGVLLYFGYPAADEHDTERAVRAGLAILEAVGSLKTSSGVTLQASAGIATGLVVVGEKPGTGDTRQRVAIGETANLATRLQTVAGPGEVVISARTRRLVGRMFDSLALPAGEVKGLAQPVEAWQVRGETTGVSRFEALRAALLSPFVGRQEEIDLLLRRWGQAKAGEGRVVLLLGEPGIGKSRIAESLVIRLEGEPHARLRYFCSPHHTHSPLYPIIAQLERAVGFEPGSSASTKLDKLEALLKPAATNVPRDVALIAELLAVPVDGRYPALALDPQQKREMTFTALLNQLDGAARQQPILIVVEDAHWIDPTSLDLLDRMVARAANLPVLLVVTFRPEFQPNWVGEPHVSMLPLSRLGRGDSASIIGSITQDKALPEAIVEQILSHADGVPLFIEELTNTLLESRLSRETAGSHVFHGPLPPHAIPTTLQASLMARLDRLGPVKDVAMIGAAIGREFSHGLIAAVSAWAPMDLDTALERVTASGLISRRGAPPDTTYSFKHALIQDAAYGTLLKSRRRQLHATIAKVLIEQFPALAESQPEVVAHHFTEASLASEAIGYWHKAGQLAGARSANLEAVKSFDQALHLLETLPESQSTLEQGCDLRLELRPVLSQLGEGRRLRQRLREAEALAERLNDDRRRGQVGSILTNVHTALGDLDEALACGTRALAIARELGDLEMRIRSTNYLAQAAFYRGDHNRVVDLTTDSLAVLPLDWVHKRFVGPATLASVYSRSFLVVSLAELGRFAEAAEHEAEALRLAEPMQHAPVTVGVAHFGASLRHLYEGKWVQARSLMERWIAVCRTGNILIMLPPALSSCAWVLAQLGERSEALNLLREGEQLIEREEMNQRGWTYQALGRAALLLDRLDEARRLANRALESSPSHFGFAAHAQCLLGEIAIHPDRFDAESGEVHYRQALALAMPRGMRVLVAHSQLGLGKLYQRTGKLDQARDHLATATTMYREMDMRFGLERAKAEMRQLQ
jgi:class 3 adenylate cyclase/DNA-binding SARP family transcriptional activator